MTNMIHGQSVVLHVHGTAATDPFGQESYEDSTVEVENVICEPASNDAIIAELQMTGKHIAYVLHIPKGDEHDWEDTTVEFNGKTWKTYGDCLEYDETMTPLSWNKKIKVERFE